MNQSFVLPDYIPRLHEAACADAVCAAKQHRKDLPATQFYADPKAFYVEGALQGPQGALDSRIFRWENAPENLRKESLGEVQQAHNVILRALSAHFQTVINPLGVVFRLLDTKETEVSVGSKRLREKIQLVDADASFLPANYEKTVHGVMLYLYSVVLRAPAAADAAISPAPVQPVLSSQPRAARESVVETPPSPTADVPSKEEAPTGPSPAAPPAITAPPVAKKDPYDAITRQYIDFMDTGEGGNWAEEAARCNVASLLKEEGVGYFSLEELISRPMPRLTEKLRALAQGELSDDGLGLFLGRMYQKTLRFWLKNITPVHAKTYQLVSSLFKKENTETKIKIYYKYQAARNLLMAFEAVKQLDLELRSRLLKKFIASELPNEMNHLFDSVFRNIIIIR